VHLWPRKWPRLPGGGFWFPAELWRFSGYGHAQRHHHDGGRVPLPCRDGLFIRKLGDVHSRLFTAGAGHWVQAVWRSCSVAGGWRVKTGFRWPSLRVGFSTMIAASTICVSRAREPDTPAPFIAHEGYPCLPALFIVAAAVMLYHVPNGHLTNSWPDPW